jgi:hypothetical protein
VCGVIDDTGVTDQSIFTAYVNGVGTTETGKARIGNTGEALKIGGRDLGPPLTQPFSGKIDDVRIYNRALSATEIQQLYLMGK